MEKKEFEKRENIANLSESLLKKRNENIYACLVVIRPNIAPRCRNYSSMTKQICFWFSNTFVKALNPVYAHIGSHWYLSTHLDIDITNVSYLCIKIFYRLPFSIFFCSELQMQLEPESIIDHFCLCKERNWCMQQNYSYVKRLQLHRSGAQKYWR